MMRTVSKQDLEKKINQKCTQVNAVLHTKVDYLFRRLTKVELDTYYFFHVRPSKTETNLPHVNVNEAVTP
jgi:hypothetical protein